MKRKAEKKTWQKRKEEETLTIYLIQKKEKKERHAPKTWRYSLGPGWTGSWGGRRLRQAPGQTKTFHLVSAPSHCWRCCGRRCLPSHPYPRPPLPGRNYDYILCMKTMKMTRAMRLAGKRKAVFSQVFCGVEAEAHSSSVTDWTVGGVETILLFSLRPGRS